MAELPPNWASFFASIEGRQSTFSAPMLDGKPTWGIEGIAPDAQQNFSILVGLLRGDAPLPPEVRSWLADLFDERSDSEFQIKGLARRHRGKPPAAPGQHFEAVRRFRVMIEEGMDRQKALWEAGKDDEKDAVPRIMRSTMEKAIAEFEEAERVGHADAWDDET
ncbi:hypothetical protein ASF28_11370 [Methylobacterium sp. Leaf99]|uniref:hypothetical protein n=1 Tax=Methylobacterium sp. Leaf99 TaxID=1736251 RepID=UPI0006FAFF0A|nr:hypothetical protein [Methylobacterium sp. Leaf99]KQP07719.1 hypothetical protein ASF28_11370 [Methylobacterium sp. Leaf99]